MKEWARLPEEGRLPYQAWARLKAIQVLEVHYGLS